MRKGTLWVPLEVDCWEADVSDGHHTFGELYAHIDALTMRLCDLGGCTSTKAMNWKGGPLYKVRFELGDYIIRDLPRSLWKRLNVSELEGGGIPDGITSTRHTIFCLLGGQHMPPLKEDSDTEGVIHTPGESIKVGCAVGKVSNGEHTFNELYALSYAFFIALCHKCWDKDIPSPRRCIVWKSLKHQGGGMYEDYFVAGIELPGGPISYHLPIELWDMLKVPALDKAPPYDGHTLDQIVERLLQDL
jgi:hypothetical protein